MMKEKTVWENWGRNVKGYGFSRLEPGKIFFEETADVRWANCYGKEAKGDLGVSLGHRSKILGDGDSRRE